MTLTDDDRGTAAVVAERRRRKPLVIVGLGAGLLIVGAVYVGGWTPLMGVNTVTVEGETTLTAQQLITTAAIPNGTPLMRVDVRAATARIADLPQVSSVDVRRVWPRTVVITVSEREAVAMQKTGSGWELLDENGNPFAMAPSKPKDLPTIQRSPDPATNTAMFDVLASLPPQIRAEVASVAAESPNAVRLTLRGDGAIVNWGSADASDFKAQVLDVLLQTESGWYDVSNPNTPTTGDAPPVPKPVPSPTPSEPTAQPSPSTSPSAFPEAEGSAQPATTPLGLTAE
jgi:cell division protein FtsQ